MIDSLAKHIRDEGGEWWEGYYSESFRKVFNADKEETFSDRTRIGRALNLFCEGLRLPRFHSFLSMCLVLETLFTIGEGEISHKFAVRLSKIIGAQGRLGETKGVAQEGQGDLHRAQQDCAWRETDRGS